MRFALLLSLFALAVPSLGCGAAMSTYLILVAQAELDGAEAAEAEKYAPYEYTAASEYLHKAREEQGYADFGPAIEFAFKAQELAEKGRIRAEKVKASVTPPPGANTEPLPVDPDPEPSSGGIIIKKKPDPDPSATPPPAPPTEDPALVPPGGAAPDDDGEDPPAVEIVPITPEQPQG